MDNIQYHHLWNMFLQSPIPTFVVNRQCELVAYNDATISLSGYTRHEIDASRDITFWMEKIIDTSTVDSLLTLCSGLFEKEFRLSDFEYEIMRKGGEKRIIRLSGFDIILNDKPLDPICFFAIDITDPRNAENVMKEIEDRYKALFYRSRDLVYLHDLEGNFIDANPAALRLLGLKRREIGYMNISEILDQEQIEKAFANLKEILIKGYQKGLTEYKVMKNNGDTLELETNSSLLFRAGKPYALQGIARDVTERKLTERQIKQAKEKYESLIGNIPIVVYSAIPDKSRTTIFISDKWQEWTGYYPKEFYDNPMIWQDTIHPEDREYAFDSFSHAYSNHEEYSIVYRVIHKESKEIRYLRDQAKPVTDDAGIVTMYDGIIEEITERQKAEDRLLGVLEQLKDFESIVNRSPAVVFLWKVEEEWPVEFVSENVRQFGYSPDDFLSGTVSWPGVTHPDDVQRLENELIKFQNSGIDEFYQEYRLITRPGKIRWVEDHTKAIKNHLGEITHYQGIILDKTDRHKAEDNLHHRVGLEQLISQMSREFINIKPEDTDKEINRQLGAIGRFFETDRMYIFEITEDGAILNNTHEWCDDGIESLFSHNQGIKSKKYPWWINTLNKLESISISDVAALPQEAAPEMRALQEHDIKSLLAVPILYAKKLKGYLGLDYVRELKVFDEDDATILKTAGDIFINALERKKATEAIRESEKKYHSLTESINDIIYSMDIDGVFSYIGPQVSRYGYKPTYVTGRSIFDFIHPDDLEQVKDDFHRIIATGEELSFQFRFVDKLSDIHWVEDKSMIQVNKSGSITGIAGIFRDITERKRTEDALQISDSKLREQKYELEQKNIALREIIGQIEIEKNTIKDDVIANVDTIVLPLIDKLALKYPENDTYALLRHLLGKLTSSFGRKATTINYKLTPRELEICTMVESGLMNKEISELLNISCQTVENHRKNIRKKLDISNKGINLASYLQQL